MLKYVVQMSSFPSIFVQHNLNLAKLKSAPKFSSWRISFSHSRSKELLRQRKKPPNYIHINTEDIKRQNDLLDRFMLLVGGVALGDDMVLEPEDMVSSQRKCCWSQRIR